MQLGFAESDITPNRPLSLTGLAAKVRLGRRGERPLLAQTVAELVEAEDFHTPREDSWYPSKLNR